MSSDAYLPVSEIENMEKLQVFQKPLCLIRTDKDGKLCVVEGTMSQLEEIPCGVNVVAMTGLYRTGKSYLMNRLANVTSGFALGNKTEPGTKGIWVWCKRHPTQNNQVLVLLDTEGLGVVKMGDIQHDNTIFTLAALLSSTLVYNMMGAFNQDAVEKLTFITEMSKNIKVGEGMGGDKFIDFVLPRLVLCLRDFFLEPVAEGRKLTPDEYLEDCLKSKQVKTQEDEKYNRPRECIRRYFTRRRVFTFDRPGTRKVMSKLETVHDDDLSEEFVEDTIKFTSYIFQCEPKMLINRQLVSGSMLAQLAREYVKSMREGGVPCVDDAMTTMARKENETLIKKAVSEFEEKMKAIQLPIYNSKELPEINFKNQKTALATLVKGLVFDDTDEAKTSAEERMNDIARLYVQKNDEQLQKICMDKLEDYYKPIAENISNDKYDVSGGYQTYKKDMSELEEKYFEKLQRVDHAVRMKVLKSFLDKTRKAEEKVLGNDQQLTEQENRKSAHFTDTDGGMEAGLDFNISSGAVFEYCEESYSDNENTIDEGKQLTAFEDHQANVNVDKVRATKADKTDLLSQNSRQHNEKLKQKRPKVTQEMVWEAQLQLFKEQTATDIRRRQLMEVKEDFFKAATAALKKSELSDILQKSLKKESNSGTKLKESQDLMMKKSEKQKLEHEENVRRIAEEQRRKEEADLKKNIEAIMQARQQNEAHYEDLRRQNERRCAESRRDVIVRAWDFLFRD